MMTQTLQRSLPLRPASVHVLEARDYSRHSFCSDIVALREIQFASFFYRGIILSKLHVHTANFILRVYLRSMLLPTPSLIFFYSTKWKYIFIGMSPSTGSNVGFRIIHSSLLTLRTQTHCSRPCLVT
jgi:hypothetical protein